MLRKIERKLLSNMKIFYYTPWATPSLQYLDPPLNQSNTVAGSGTQYLFMSAYYDYEMTGS